MASFEKFKKKKGRNISSERIIGSLRLRLPLEGKNLSSECLSPVWRLRCLLFIHVLKADRIKSHKDDASPESETSSSSFDRLPQLPVCLVLFIGNSLTPSLRGSLPTYLDIKILEKKILSQLWRPSLFEYSQSAFVLRRWEGNRLKTLSCRSSCSEGGFLNFFFENHFTLGPV